MTNHTDFACFAFGRFRNLSLVKTMFAIWGRFAYAQAKTVIVPSERARSFAQLQGAGECVTVIPNGIHLANFQKPVSLEERYWANRVL